jgi:hypothetical protein
VNFGEPIRVVDYLTGYPETKHDCIQKLTAEIEHRIESLILHLPRLERARVIEAVKRLYLDRLLVGNRVIHEPVPPKAGELLLTQAIASAVEFTYENHFDRAMAFARKLDHYERWLKRLNLSDEELAHLPNEAQLASRSIMWALLGIVLFPVAAYGWVHRLLPIAFVNWAIRRFAELSINKTHISTTALLAGVVGFTGFYGACVAVFYGLFGWPACVWYALSLPVAGLVAHYYVRGLRRFAVSLRSALVLLRARSAAWRLLVLRNELIAEIESARWQVPAEALAHQGKGPP